MHSHSFDRHIIQLEYIIHIVSPWGHHRQASLLEVRVLCVLDSLLDFSQDLACRTHRQCNRVLLVVSRATIRFCPSYVHDPTVDSLDSAVAAPTALSIQHIMAMLILMRINIENPSLMEVMEVMEVRPGG